MFEEVSDTHFLSGYSSFPGGMSESVDHDEDQAQMLRNTAIREFEEELGVTATQIGVYAKDLVSLGYWNSPPYLGALFQTHYFMVVLDHDFLGQVKLSESLTLWGGIALMRFCPIGRSTTGCSHRQRSIY